MSRTHSNYDYLLVQQSMTLGADFALVFSPEVTLGKQNGLVEMEEFQSFSAYDGGLLIPPLKANEDPIPTDVGLQFGRLPITTTEAILSLIRKF